LNINKLAIVFFALLVAMVLPISAYTYLDAKASQNNDQIRNAMTDAAYDSMQAVQKVDGYAFRTDPQKKAVLDGFYASLASSYGYTSNTNQVILQSYIPFVAMADNDGVYVCYSKDYGSWNSGQYLYNTTPLASYSETYSVSNGKQYAVQFYLNGSSSVYENGKLIATGDYPHVVSILNKDYPDSILSLPFYKQGSNDEQKKTQQNQFNEECRMVVTNVITRTVEQYMNKGLDDSGNNGFIRNGGNDGYNRHNIQYSIKIPQGDRESWARALTSPTVISFWEGVQVDTGTSVTVQYALTGGELDKQQKYYVDGNGYYHSTLDCEHISGTVNKQKTYTMEEAAGEGYYPCPYCIK
jgi:hypothetical protein